MADDQPTDNQPTDESQPAPPRDAGDVALSRSEREALTGSAMFLEPDPPVPADTPAEPPQALLGPPPDPSPSPPPAAETEGSAGE